MQIKALPPKFINDAVKDSIELIDIPVEGAALPVPFVGDLGLYLGYKLPYGLKGEGNLKFTVNLQAAFPPDLQMTLDLFQPGKSKVEGNDDFGKSGGPIVINELGGNLAVSFGGALSFKLQASLDEGDVKNYIDTTISLPGEIEFKIQAKKSMVNCFYYFLPST